jgi:hypothetical protein
VVFLLVINSGITISTWFRWSSSLKQYPPRIFRMATLSAILVKIDRPLQTRQDVSFYPEQVTILTSLVTGIESYHFL